MPHRRLQTAIAAAAMLAASPLAAAPVDLLSHRAAYRLSLDRAESGMPLESVRGGLVLEWRADCSGWLSQQRLGYVGQPEDGPSFTTDIRFSSWEAPDFTRLRFAVRSFDDGKVADEFKGVASVAGPGGPGQVDYGTPTGLHVTLPSGTLFPTEHVKRLIEAASAGERLLTSYVFDGSGPDALNKVTAVIGDPKTSPATPDAPEERHWRVNLAYYDIGQADELPTFQLAYDLGEHGVLRDLVLNYGEFALRGELEKLEPLSELPCG